MTDTSGLFQRYACGGLYMAAGFAMAVSGALESSGDRPLVQVVGGLAVGFIGGAVVRESRRQGQLGAASPSLVVAMNCPVPTIRVCTSAIRAMPLRRRPTRDDLVA
jgi:hypothetical protein